MAGLPTRLAASVVLFTTCYGNYNLPTMVEDLVAVFEHNGIPVDARKLRSLLRYAEA